MTTTTKDSVSRGVGGGAALLGPFLSASDARAALSSFGAAATTKCAGAGTVNVGQMMMAPGAAQRSQTCAPRQQGSSSPLPLPPVSSSLNDTVAAASAASPPADIPLDIPVFLQNSYRMIDSCDDTIAGWCADGTSFVIKDADRLASDIIPRFFKHNKYSSFVRQLNFYGFRKVRRDAANLVESIHMSFSPSSSKPQQIFHHEYFLRGRPDLLRNVKRPNQVQGGVERQEVDELRREVNQLKAQVAFLVRHMQGQRQHQHQHHQHQHQHHHRQPQTQVSEGCATTVSAAATVAAMPAPPLVGKRQRDDIHQVGEPRQQQENHLVVDESNKRQRRMSRMITPPPSPGIAPLLLDLARPMQQAMPPAVPLMPTTLSSSHGEQQQERHVMQQQAMGQVAQQQQQHVTQQWEYEASLFADEELFVNDLAALVS
eukprot:CAMPEP_0113544824 /NCGR_PEP_ID=MMETSP0015_2-20120614/10919_1 /TAXON_ID=2838 /ORGANISM="Odontella" /LENGTH=428 /DNA_ID=CAMNT_0000445119 /DNA_START=267 /DNA_END=1553 /DNA_ORIENTATION=- /assembly_acc=CAM_ASM_000160